MTTAADDGRMNLAAAPQMKAALDEAFSDAPRTGPLAFPFDRYYDLPGTAAEDAFAAAHPGAHYVVLRVDNPRELAVLLDDLASYSQYPLLTPVQEHAVHAEPVAVIRTAT